MYELTVDTHFSAAHSLRGYIGDCARLHGHTWSVSVTVNSKKLDKLGLSIDFKEIASVLDEIVGRLDHQTLNNLKEFTDLNPTAENLARLLFGLLSEKINSEDNCVFSVTVGESDRCRVTYRKDEEK